MVIELKRVVLREQTQIHGKAVTRWDPANQAEPGRYRGWRAWLVDDVVIFEAGGEQVLVPRELCSSMEPVQSPLPWLGAAEQSPPPGPHAPHDTAATVAGTTPWAEIRDTRIKPERVEEIKSQVTDEHAVLKAAFGVAPDAEVIVDPSMPANRVLVTGDPESVAARLRKKPGPKPKTRAP